MPASFEVPRPRMMVELPPLTLLHHAPGEHVERAGSARKYLNVVYPLGVDLDVPAVERSHVERPIVGLQEAAAVRVVDVEEARAAVLRHLGSRQIQGDVSEVDCADLLVAGQIESALRRMGGEHGHVEGGVRPGPDDTVVRTTDVGKPERADQPLREA